MKLILLEMEDGLETDTLTERASKAVSDIDGCYGAGYIGDSDKAEEVKKDILEDMREKMEEEE